MSCPSSSKSTRKRKLQTSDCEKPSKKRMAWDSFNSIEDFGYKFSEEGRLVNIQDGSGFNFYVDEQNHWYNQKNYEALGEVITEHIYELLQSDDVGLKKLEIPQEKGSSNLSFAKQTSKSDEAKGFIFVSEDFDQKDRLLVLVHGSGVVRAGQWARRLIINDCLDHGTQIPYIKRAIRDGYGVVVTNTNQNEALVEVKGQKKYKSIKESESPERHFSYVWKNIIEKTSASKIFAVAHSYGGYLVVNYFDRYPNILGRVVAVAFTDSVHNLRSNARANVRSWFLKNSVNWATSDDELDTPMYYQDDNNHLTRVSAGTTKHEETSWKAMESVFKYFQNQELDFDNKKSEAGKCERNTSKNKNQGKKALACSFSKTEIKKKSNNEQNREKNPRFTSELLKTRGESKKSENSIGQNEYVGEGSEVLMDVEEIKKSDAISDEPSKTEHDSESDNKNETTTVEMSKKASEESKSSEQKSDGGLDEDALKSVSETPDEMKEINNKESDYKQSGNSLGQDEYSEHVEDDEASKNIEKLKENDAIASGSSKTEHDSESDKASDNKETTTVEMSKRASEESKASEQKSDGGLDEDALKSGSETPDEMKEINNKESDYKQSGNSLGQDEYSEHVEDDEASKNIEKLKENDAIASGSSKTEHDSESDKASDDKETTTVEMSKKASEESKSSEQKSDGGLDEDALKSGSETPDEMKEINNKESDYKQSGNSLGQDEYSEHVEDDEASSKDIEEMKGKDVIASKSSKLEDGSELDKINDDKREAITVEIPKKPSEESTSSEQESKDAVDGDALNTGPEIPDDVRNKSNNEAQNIEPEKSPRHDEKNENKESEKALNNIEEKGNGAIASESSKTEDGSEPDKANDGTKGTITVEVSAVANRETKSSEEKGEGDFEKDALKCGAETPDKVKCTSNSEGDNNKPEDSPGQDEMNKSIEGEDEMVKNGEGLNKKEEIHSECVDSEANGAIENQPAKSAASNTNGGQNIIDLKSNEPSDEVVGSKKEQTDNNSENSGDDPSEADASSTNDEHEKKLEADKVEKKPAEVSSEDKLPKQENVDKTSNGQDETVNNAGKSTTSWEGKNEGDQATPDAPGGIGENLGTDSFNNMPETFIV